MVTSKLHSVTPWNIKMSIGVYFIHPVPLWYPVSSVVHSTKSVKQSDAQLISTDLVGPWCMFCDEVDLGAVFGLFSVFFHWLLYHLILTFVNSIQGRK